MPLTMTRPCAARIKATAATKLQPSPSCIAAPRAVRPPASASSVRNPQAIRAWSSALIGSSSLRSPGVGMRSPLSG